MPRARLGDIGKRGAASAIGVVVLAFLTAASQKSPGPDSAAQQADANKSTTSSLEEELQSFEQQLGAPSSAESLFANGRAPDLVVISSTDVHGEIEPCG
jgi:hypothetical protein